MSRIRIIKTNRRNIQRESITKSQMSAEGIKALEQLDECINTDSPALIKFLVGRFRAMQDIISYEDLRDAFLSGNLDESKIDEWRQAYSQLITDIILPAWRESMDQASINQEDLKDFKWDNFSDNVKRFTQTRTADLITKVTDQQKDAIASLTERVTTGEFTADELAKAIRPTIGLNAPQQKANANYYAHVKAQLTKDNPKITEAEAESKAREAALKYAEKQQRYRAQMIAENEIALAYKTGVQEAMHQAVDQGVMKLNVKTWVTAGTELVCEECGALNGITIKLDDHFRIGGFITHHDGYYTIEGGRETEVDGHAHVKCKCACTYHY
ncbi:hypothetical protein [Acetobacterium tundrae]|uniref:Phage head morphogenesis domain-containing protein n=1 Tax=Acetobacterium tundrae TaxID=132932 RepID=A0ABR6WNH4_9FIRM|nr:hypothetical protein [Acetobacterium tundrae]MBC3798039.1 hypothetical protein [Acetobacterium tundrae]